MRNAGLQLVVGLFMLVGIGCLAYLSIHFGNVDIFGREGYQLTATFANVGGLKQNAEIVIAGVSVGEVQGISLKDYEAEVVLLLNESVTIQEDAIAAIKTRGLIGEKYIEILPGASETTLSGGDAIRETEPAVNLEDLISKYVFGDL